jgi:hypothetical protein
MTIKRGRLFLGAVVILLVTACASSVSAQKMAQIKPGMNADQVEAILGRPAHIDQSETTGLQGQVYHYPGPNGEGQIVFLNNAVFDAKFVPGARGA